MKEIKNTLLLGANGFIGKNIIDKYLEYNNKIIILNREEDKLETKYLLNSKIHVVEGALINIELIKSTINKFNIKTVIHLVSSLIPSSSIEKFHNDIEAVVYPTFEIIDYLCKKNIKFIFFSSGGTIYGKSNFPVSEKHKIEPVNYYGYSKLMIEQYIKFKHRTDNLQYIILRPSTLFGKYQRLDGKQGFIAIATKNISNEKEVEIWGDGKTVRDYIDVSDVVETLFTFLDKNIINESINIGSGNGYNQLEIIRIIENYINKKATIRYRAKSFADVDYMVLDIEKLKSLINFKPQTVNEGIKKFVKLILEYEE